MCQQCPRPSDPLFNIDTVLSKYRAVYKAKFVTPLLSEPQVCNRIDCATGVPIVGRSGTFPEPNLKNDQATEQREIIMCRCRSDLSDKRCNITRSKLFILYYQLKSR